MKAATGNGLFVGTSGYCYRHWGRGVFYPPRLGPRQWLSFYARYFTTVELNMSFYRRPKLEFLSRWAETTPPGFVFAAKLNRMITHYQKLKSCAATLADEKVLRDGLGPKLEVVLAQLPPTLAADFDLLRSFLDLTREAPGRWIPRLAVEFRHPSWQKDRTYRLLDDYNASVCLADWGPHHFTKPNHADFIYFRRHFGQDRGSYTGDQIRADARKIARFLKAGRRVYLYFNNDLHGFAVRNARELLTVLGRWAEPPPSSD